MTGDATRSSFRRALRGLRAGTVQHSLFCLLTVDLEFAEGDLMQCKSKYRGATIVMGVSGSGKTTVGSRLAQRLEVPFIEGDELHPPSNIAKLSAGIALDDEDRWPWLAAIAQRIADTLAANHGVVAACSALKRSYRDYLGTKAGTSLTFVFLAGSIATLAPRLAARRGHFMPATLLQSQLQTLEMPDTGEHALTLDIRETPAALVDKAYAFVLGANN